MTNYQNWLIFFSPELILIVGLLMGLMRGAFSRQTRANREGMIFSVVVILIAAMASATFIPFNHIKGFENFLEFTPLTALIKTVVYSGSAITLLLTANYLEKTQSARFEIGSLFLTSCIAMGVLISANSFISLYLGLELLSLSLYILATCQRDNSASSEAGLKYFILGALSSGLLLFGISLVYGFTGSVSFDVIAERAGEIQGYGLATGLVFVVAGIAFKISAVPFHMWTPDVYEGAPTPITAFFASAPKVAVFVFLIRMLYGPFANIQNYWQDLIIVIAIASMVWGALAALRQTNIKRLLAYSSIGHMGYALAGLASSTPEALQSVTMYLIVYLISSIGVFAAVIAMRKKNVEVLELNKLAGIWRTNPEYAATMAIFMFSLAGIPWMAGFFAKFYIFVAIIDAKLYALAVIMVLSSVVAAYYYLKIIKIMYFDEASETLDVIAPDCKWTMRVSGAFAFFFFLFPSALLSISAVAAEIL